MRSYWSLKLSEVVFFSLFLFCGSAFAQFSPDKIPLPRRAEKNNYLFPIKPGNTALLTGTMGELRSTHFHAGLDIDTPGIGVPVLSVDDGYISRATATTSGYGNVLYVTHTDGNTTVYAHLDEFKGAVGDYIRKERYSRKVSETDLTFLPNQFKVSKGEVLALSGNTGGSGGPHLHFEVRNENNEAINPLTYDFTEVMDNVSPLVFKVALKTMDIKSRINDQFGRFEFSVVKNGSNYFLPYPILATGNIGIEILAHDKMENSRFHYGINYIDMRIDSQLVFTQTIDKINFNETRGILALMDYKVLELNGARYNKLYIDDGNRLDYYSGVTKKNGVALKETETQVDIRLKDFNGNLSKVHFVLKQSPAVIETSLLTSINKPIVTEIQENILKVTCKACSNENKITLWEKGKPITIDASYTGANQYVFLVNLQTLLPDSIQSCQGTVKTNLKDKIPSETEYKYYSDWVDIEFPRQSLYDTAFLELTYDTLQGQEFFTIGNRTQALSKSISITLKPKLNYFQSRNLGLYRKEGKGFIYVPYEWKSNRVKFNSRNFGQFTFLRDTIPPIITKIGLSTAAARFKIRDNLSGISYFEANLNGQWLLMVYDYKTGILKSEKLDSTKMLIGDFELKVVDQAGNESIFKQKI